MRHMYLLVTAHVAMDRPAESMDTYVRPHLALRGLVQGDYHAGSETIAPGDVISVPASLSMSFNLNLAEPPPGFPAAHADAPGHLYQYGGGSAPVQVEWIGFRLTSLGAYTLIGEQLRDVVGRVVDLEDIFGASGRILAEQCRSARTLADRFTLVDEFLMRCASVGPKPNSEIVQAWHRLSASAGRVTIADLAADAGWSVDHFGRMFRRQIGLPPKTLGRLMRLVSVLQHADPSRARWSQIAIDHGFSDQPHLNRDMREFTGMSPSVYFSRLRSCGCLAAKPPQRARQGSDSSKTVAALRS